MLTAIIGLTGVLLGIFLNEYFRRRSRVELYSKEVFQKRLNVYEELYQKIQASYSIAQDVIENPDYSKEERHGRWSNVVLNIAAFTDEHGLYLNTNVVVHCMTMLLGIEDIHDEEDPEEKKELIARFGEDYANAKKMIKKETGLESLDRLFGSISKAQHESDYISYYESLKKESGK